jgi:uncharacterized protein YcgI (DUF1989 family)
MTSGVTMRRRIEPMSGVAFDVREGAELRVIDPLGQQVADLVSFDAHDHGDWLSSGRTLDYNGKIYFTKSDVLYSNRSEAHWTVVEDSVGRHDFLLAPCSREMFARLYDPPPDRPGCFGNLASALAPHGIAADAIPVTFNVFMNVAISATGELRVEAPRSRADDYVILRAEKDLLVGLTACSAEKSNNGTLKPIDFEIGPGN